MDAILYDKIGKEADRLEDYLLAQFPQETVTNQAVASINDGADDILIRQMVVAVEPVQSGSGDPAPDNVRPISGWTGAKIARTRKNLFDKSQYEDIVSAGITSSDNYKIKPIKLKPNTQYTISITPTTAETSPILLLNNTDHINTTGYFDCRLGVRTTKTFTTDTTGNLWIGAYNNTTDAAVNARIETVKLQIEEGSTDTDYELFGQTYSITFPQAAGTVYGGELTINQDGTGTLVVDKGKIILDGTQEISVTNWRAEVGSVAWLYPKSLTNNKAYLSDKDIPDVISDNLKTVSYKNTYQAEDSDTVSLVLGSLYGIAVRSHDTSLTTQNAINSYLSSNPITVVYPLATPTTYSLTAVQIKTILGLNNVWADTGNIKKLTYRADLGKFLVSNIAANILNANS